MGADCIVVGGGINGLLTALELRTAGLAVQVLDKGPVGREASWAGGGILSPLRPWRQPEPVTRLASWSQTRWPALCGELRELTGVDPQWWRCGLLVLGAEPGEQARAEAWAGRAEVKLEGLAEARSCGRAACLARDRAAEVALWLPEVAQVRNPRLVRALRTAALKKGVALSEGEAAERIEVAEGRVAAVRTSSGRRPCGCVVLAAGAWTPGLLPSGVRRPDVEPVRGQMVLWRGRPGLLETIVLAGERYLIPRRDGRILCGSTVERVGFDRAATPEARQALTGAGVALCPALAALPVEAHWAGLRPAAPAGIPYVCVHPEAEGLFLNVGQYRNGVVLAPASARLTADLVLGREPVLPPGPYAFDAPRDAGQHLNS